MKEVNLPLGDLALIAGTRGMIGVGIGLLLADKLNAKQARAIGWTLLLAGALSTVPLAIRVFGRLRQPPRI